MRFWINAKILGTLLMTALVFFSCNADKCFNSTGPIDEMEIEIGPIDKITVSDYIDLRVVQSDEEKAILRAGANVIEHISVDYQSEGAGHITISDLNKCRWLRNMEKRPEVEIHTPHLSKINFFSHGDLVAEDWNLSHLEVESLRSGRDFYIGGEIDTLRFLLEKGSPDLYLTGNSDFVFIYHFGSGFVYAEELIANRIHLHHNSTGDFHIFPIEELFAEIHGRGNVYYYNEPNEMGGPIIGSGRILPGN
ncbi:MAG: DUF2807 domain-containing protein [Saprospirales bacterium]|nr:MAG: DUF2807 domain-containing protein [Saprospirales bacterium]